MEYQRGALRLQSALPVILLLCIMLPVIQSFMRNAGLSRSVLYSSWTLQDYGISNAVMILQRVL